MKRHYVFDVPAFVVDNYVQKLFSHFGVPSRNYQDVARQITFPADFTSHGAQIFHGLIDELGKKDFRGQRIHLMKVFGLPSVKDFDAKRARMKVSK